MPRLALAALVLLWGCGDDGDASPEEALFSTVGQRTLTVVDTTRPTMPNGSFPGAPSRTLETEIWYPGLAGPDALETIPCQPDPVREHAPRRTCTLGRDLHLDLGQSPYPLIVFSHGFGSSKESAASFAPALAQHGYVIVAPSFPLSRRGAPGAPTVADLAGQAGDVSFLLDVSLGLVAGAPAPFPGRVDAARLGTAGESLGGATTLLVSHHTAFRDPRLRASAALSPAFDVATRIVGRAGFFDGISTPLLILGGSADTLAPFPQNQQVPFDLASPPKLLVEFEAQGHVPRTAATNITLLAFFNAFLRGRAADLAALDALVGARVQRVP